MDGQRLELSLNLVKVSDFRSAFLLFLILLSLYFCLGTYVIDALQPNTTYLVRVASVNRAGLSDWRGPVRLETDSQIKEVYNDRPSSATTIYPITFATLSTFYRFFIHLFLGYVN